MSETFEPAYIELEYKESNLTDEEHRQLQFAILQTLELINMKRQNVDYKPITFIRDENKVLLESKASIDGVEFADVKLKSIEFNK